MKIYSIIPVILFSTFIAEASQDTSVQANDQHYAECVGVSLYTMEGRELNSIVRDKRSLEKTNKIPEGWTVIGVSAKEETGLTVPYLVICR